MNSSFPLLLGFVYLAAIVVTIHDIIFKTRLQGFQKLLWIFLILSAPLIGMLVFYFASDTNYSGTKQKVVAFILSAFITLLITLLLMYEM